MKTVLKYGMRLVFVLISGATVYNMYTCRYNFDDALIRTILFPIASTTIWAPDFTEKGFSKIKLGIPKIQVRAAIGHPLHKFCDEENEMDEACDWIYTRQGTNLDAYDRRAISFDDQGKVDYIWHEFYTNQR